MVQVKLIIRNLFKHWLTTLLKLIGLSIGFALFVLISLWIKQILSVDKSVENKELIYRIICEKNTNEGIVNSAFTPFGLASQLEDRFPEINTIGRLSLANDFEVRVNNIQLPTKYALADDGFLKIFKIKLTRGDSSQIMEIPSSIIINESVYQKYFNNQDILGSKVTDKKYHIEQGTIAGVYKDIPTNSHFDLGAIQSINMRKIYDPRGYNNHWTVYTYVMLKPNVDSKKFEGKINSYYALIKKGDINVNFKLEPINDIYLESDLQDDFVMHGNKQQVVIFAFITIFILIISSINYINLTTAISESRSHEIGVQKILGATKGKLMLYHLSESVFVSFIAAIIGIILSILCMSSVNRLLNIQLTIGNWGNGYYVSGLLIFFLFVGLISGLYPAIRISGLRAISILGKNNQSIHFSTNIRKVLVGFQFFISIVLLSNTLIVFQQLNYLKNVDLGIAKKNIITLPLGCACNYDFLNDKFSSIRGVIRVSASDSKPTDINSFSNNFNWEGKDTSKSYQFYFNTVSSGYLETYHIRVIEGRSFSEDFPSDVTSAFIVNEECARQMGFDDHSAVGRTMSYGTKRGEIIGVIKNYYFQSFRKSVNPLVLFIDRENWSIMNVEIDPTISRNELLNSLKNSWGKVNISDPFSYSFIEDNFNSKYKDERILFRTLTYLTIIAIIIALLGIVGFVIHLAQKSKREVAIRKVFGASRRSLLVMFSKNNITITLIAMLISLPVVIYSMDKWLSTFEIHINIGYQHFIYPLLILIVLSQSILFILINKTVKLNPSQALSEL